jgi:hypothetical protein
MPAPPAMTAAVESVSPAMCRKAERMFTSRATPHSSAAITPFITTPAAATIIISRGCTITGIREPVHGLNADPERDDDERGGVDEGGQHAGALVAEGARVVGRARLEVDRGKAEQQGQKIRGVVAGLRQQRQRVRAQPRNERDHHVGERGHQREAQNIGCPICALSGRRRVDMHTPSVTGDGYTAPLSWPRSAGRNLGLFYPHPLDHRCHLRAPRNG